MPEFLMSPGRAKLVEELVKRLPDVRKRLRLSQEELGQMVGKSRQKISDIERFAAPMGWDTYIATCIALEHLKAFDARTDEWYFESKENWYN